jgi:cytochrome b561
MRLELVDREALMSVEVLHPEPVARYNRVAMTLHWVVASLLVVNIAVGLAAANADDANVRSLVDLHKSLGLTALGLIILRILWRLANRPPPLPSAYPKVERLGAHTAHFLLYAVMLLLPLTGYIHDSAWKLASTHPIVLYGLVHFPRIGLIESLDPVTKEHVHSIFSAAHVYLGYLLYALVALHLLGVAKHHAIDHENELQRMLPPTYKRPDGPA